MKLLIHPSYADAHSYIATLPQRFEYEGEEVFRKRNVVKRLDTSWGTWVIKRYKRPHLVQRIAYTFFKKSKAERAYLYAGRLLALGIDTPQGIAYIEQKEGGLFCNSYFISTCCPHPSIYDTLTRELEHHYPLADALAGFLVELHEKGVLHGDLNLENILYHTDKEGRYHFTLIDTNRSRFTDAPSQQECLANLKRVTHRRDLLVYLTRRYATLRGWDAEVCVAGVLQQLQKFEQRKLWKRRMKALFRQTNSHRSPQ